MKLVDEVLPPAAYDNASSEDTPARPPTPPSASMRRRRCTARPPGGQPVALVFEAVAPDGYSGKIACSSPSGRRHRGGVRVTQHRETPGLGDYIEPKKDKNKARPWISQFNGLATASLSPRDWKVKKDGGRFDANAGATVTPRGGQSRVPGGGTTIRRRQPRCAVFPEGARP